MTLQEMLHDAGALGGLAFYLISVLALAAADYQREGILLFGLLVLSYALLVPLRLLFYRVRPDKQSYKNVFQRIDSSSFPSTHAMRAAILATFFSGLFAVGFGAQTFVFIAVAGAGLVGWTRVHFKRHYWSDVIAGWILGFFLARLLIWLLMVY